MSLLFKYWVTLHPVQRTTLALSAFSSLYNQRDALITDHGFRHARSYYSCGPCYFFQLPMGTGSTPLSPGTARVANNRPFPDISEEFCLADIHQVGSAIR